MSAPAPRSRLAHALAGAALVAIFVLLEATLRWAPALAGTDLLADPQLPVAALFIGLPLGLLAGGLHRHAATVTLVAVALLAGKDPLAQLPLVLVAALLAELTWRWPLLGLLPLLGLAGGVLLLRPADGLPTQDPRPDVVLVVLDTVAANATSLHGAPHPTTPALDALAAESTDYRQAISAAPWTVPSHAALFTGLLPQDAGCHHEHPRLPDGPPTTAEHFAAAGYRTAAFVGNPWVGDFNGLTRGFAHAEASWQRSKAARAFTLLDLVPRVPGKGGPSLVPAALDWLARGDGRPAFLFLNLLEAHSPFDDVPDAGRFGVADPAAVGARTHRVQEAGPAAVPDYPHPGELDQARLLYAAAVRAADDQLASLRAGLEAAGTWDRTVLAVTSDHGEAFGEHGFHGHMVGLHAETLHVPLVVRSPGASPARVQTPVALTRLHATLLALAGVPHDSPGAAPALPTTDEPTPAPVLSEQLRPLQVLTDFARHGAGSELGLLDARAVRVQQGSLALLHQQPADGSPPRRVVYDLATDPAESHPLDPTTLDPDLLARLDAAVAPRLARFGDASPTQLELADDLRAELEALGYLGGQ